jgi:maltose-binding protein MalE
MRTVLQTQLRSGEGPDVFNWGSGPGYAGALAEAGLLYDLTDAYEEYGWPIYDFAKERVTFDGKTVGVPGEMETIGLSTTRTCSPTSGSRNRSPSTISRPPPRPSATRASFRSASATKRDGKADTC